MTALSQKALSGSMWSIGARLLARVLDLIALFILARLLTPADFGLVAIGATVTTILEATFDFPLSSVLLRHSDPRKHHLDTAFTLSMARGVVLAVFASAFAFPASLIYHDTRLWLVITVLVIGPVLRGGQSPALIRQAKELRFDQLSLIEVGGKVCGLTAAVLVAVTTHSYWALVVNTVATPSAMVTLSYLMAPHRPSLTLKSWRLFSDVLKWNSAAQLIGAANWQFDKVVLGGLIPHGVLGNYSLASTIAVLPEQALLKPIGGPMLSAFANVQSDVDQLRSLYLSSSRVVVVIATPVMLLLSFSGPDLCLLLLGSAKWAAAAPLLGVLALAPLLALPYATVPALALARGAIKAFAFRSLLEFLLQVPLLLALTFILGVQGALISRFIVAFYMLVISAFFVRRVIGLSLSAQLSCVREAGIGGIMMATSLCAANAFTPVAGDVLSLLTHVVIISALGLTSYIVGYYVSWRIFGRPAGIEVLLQGLSGGVARKLHGTLRPVGSPTE